MSDHRPPYHRRQTKPIPRADLAPVSSPTLEQLADAERERRDAEDETPTLESCPACADCATCDGRHSVECSECGSHTKDCPGACSTCPVCLGQHMLTHEDIAAWRRENDPPPEAA